jgi:hypothetical protein
MPAMTTYSPPSQGSEPTQPEPAKPKSAAPTESWGGWQAVPDHTKPPAYVPLIFIAAGLAICGMAAKIIPVEPATVYGRSISDCEHCYEYRQKAP